MKVLPVGTEHLQDSAGNGDISHFGAAKSAAFADAELKQVIGAWPNLSGRIRSLIVAICVTIGTSAESLDDDTEGARV